MKIVNVGFNQKHPDDFSIYRPYGSGDYLLLIVKSDAFFVLNGQKQAVGKNSVIIFRKDTPQIYGASGGEYVNDWIHFEPDEKEVMHIAGLGIPFDTVLPVSDTTVISGFIRGMFSEKYSVNIHKEDSLNLYFRLIILKIAEGIILHSAPKENRYHSVLSALRNDIYQDPSKARSVDNICKNMNLSRSYVQHMYKELFGESLMSDITCSRIEYAKYLLSGTDMTIDSIAHNCGYNSDVHFMRIFKKVTSLTPSQFRAQIHVSQKEIAESKRKNPFCIPPDSQK